MSLNSINTHHRLTLWFQSTTERVMVGRRLFACRWSERDADLVVSRATSWPSANWIRVKRTGESYWFNWLWFPLSVSFVCCQDPSSLCPVHCPLCCPSDQLAHGICTAPITSKCARERGLEERSLTDSLSVVVASEPKYTIVWYVIPFPVIHGHLMSRQDSPQLTNWIAIAQPEGCHSSGCVHSEWIVSIIVPD